MEIEFDTVSQSAQVLGQRLETILRRGHLYENVVASGNSNVHNGDIIHVTYNVSYNPPMSHGPTLVSADQLLPDAPSDDFARSSSTSKRKRKRATNDGGSRGRASRDNDCKAFEDALFNLGEFSRIKEHLEKGGNATRIAAYLSSILKTLVQNEHRHFPTDDTSLQPDDLIHQLKQTRCIKLNTALPDRQVALLSRQDSNVVGAQVGHWRVSLNTIVVNTQHPYTSQACSFLHAHPLRNSGGFHIAALFSRMTDMDHVANAHPMILVDKGSHSLRRPLVHIPLSESPHDSEVDPENWQDIQGKMTAYKTSLYFALLRLPEALSHAGEFVRLNRVGADVEYSE